MNVDDDTSGLMKLFVTVFPCVPGPWVSWVVAESFLVPEYMACSLLVARSTLSMQSFGMLCHYIFLLL